MPAWVWAIWAGLFVVFEGVALFNNEPGDTLSQRVWRYVTKPNSSTPATILTWILRAGIVVGAVWLGGHLSFGWWTP